MYPDLTLVLFFTLTVIISSRLLLFALCLVLNFQIYYMSSDAAGLVLN
jgi:hypothetical protein